MQGWEKESYNHILLWCPSVYKLWARVYRLLGISWVMASNIRDEI